MQENWQQPAPAPVPGQNVHQAGQPTPALRSVQRPQQPVYQQQQISVPTPARSASLSRQVPQGGMIMRR
jgi:hypothetical protein